MDEKEIRKENKMGTMAPGKLLISMSLPMMFSMLIQACYNIVDSIYLGHYSQLTLTAVSLAFPLQNLMIGFAVGTGVGIGSLISRRLGAKRLEEANDAAKHGVLLAAITFALFALLGLFFTRTFFTWFTEDASLIELGTSYTTICLVASFGVFLSVTMEKIMQATGDMISPMLVQLTGCIVNIILDPIFIFGFAGIPSMGIVGAAIATVIGQIIAALFAFFRLRKNTELSVFKGPLKIKASVIGQIYQVGAPSIIMQCIGTVMVSALNAILIAFSEAAVTVFGLYFKLQSFVFMPIFGLNSGLTPIIGYNYGAKNRERIIHTLRTAVLIAFSIMLFGMLVFTFFPNLLLGMFNADAEVTRLGIRAFRIICIHFPIAGVCITLSGLFQAIGDGWISMVNSIVRQLAVLLPAAYILSRIGGLDAIWLAFLIAELASVTISLFFAAREFRTKLSAKALSKEA